MPCKGYKPRRSRAAEIINSGVKPMNIYSVSDIGELIRDNSYVGRGIVIGKSEDGKKAVFAYFIMGRSENSRNRIFKEEGDDLTIYPFDASKVEDPSLIIYSPVRKAGGSVIVTNGDQTDTVYDYLKEGKTFEEALETRCFEPDAPNFTPRISGILNFADKDFTYKLSILKSADEEGSMPLRIRCGTISTRATKFRCTSATPTLQRASTKKFCSIKISKIKVKEIRR